MRAGGGVGAASTAGAGVAGVGADALTIEAGVVATITGEGACGGAEALAGGAG